VVRRWYCSGVLLLGDHARMFQEITRESGLTLGVPKR